MTVKMYTATSKVQADGWAVNTILWDGITPLSIQGISIVEESECTALPFPSTPPEEIPE